MFILGDRGLSGAVGSQGQKGDRGLVGPSGSPAPIVGGVTYNRWGNSNCRTGVERVYAGRTGSNSGGAANYLVHPLGHEVLAGIMITVCLVGM